MNKFTDDYLKKIKQPSKDMDIIWILNEELKIQLIKGDFKKVVEELNCKINSVINSTFKNKMKIGSETVKLYYWGFKFKITR